MSDIEICIRVAGATPGGRVIGLIDAERKVHRQTPSFTRELLGSIDANGIVRLEDGQEVGEPIAIITGTRVVPPALDTSTAPVLGFVNDAGEIRPAGSDRVLGVVDGADPLGMAFFALAYRRLITEIDELEAEVRGAKNRLGFREKLRKRAESLTDSDVLGDLNALVARLARLDEEIATEAAERKAAKERLAAEAESLADSTDWKATGERMKALFEEWKTVGSAGKEPDEALWAQFSSARERFNKRRSADFEQRQASRAVARTGKEALIERAAEAVEDEESDIRSVGDKLRDVQAKWKEAGSAGRTDDDALWARLQEITKPFYEKRTAWYAENEAQKQELIARAEELSGSDDWNATANALKGLQGEWKSIGSAGRDADEKLWTAFRAANQAFFGRRGEVAKTRDTNRDTNRDVNYTENLAAKQEIVKRAQELRWVPDPYEAAEEAKQLQARWKEIGPVPRDQADALWTVFRECCDKVFANIQSARDRRESEFTDRLKLAMDRKLEQLGEILRSIDRDEETLTRVKQQLASSPSADLDRRVEEISARLKDKQMRADEVENSLLDIRDKVHGAVE